MTRTQYTRTVDDFATGRTPGEDPLWDAPSVARPRNVRTNRRVSRVLPGSPGVETLIADTQNGYEVTVNRYNGDNEHLQVFIDKGNRSISESVSMAELDDFIARHTR